jgi:hypothetical protein
MPGKVVTANTVPVVVAAAVRNGRHYPKSMTIDNQLGAADRTITIQDEFTPNISNGVAVPVLTDVSRHKIQVPKGDYLVLEEQDLKGVKCLGNLQILADAVDAACTISVGYETD